MLVFVSVDLHLGYINDKTNRILGWATMRQLRVKPGRFDRL